jgi:hypothetical protein
VGTTWTFYYGVDNFFFEIVGKRRMMVMMRVIANVALPLRKKKHKDACLVVRIIKKKRRTQNTT